MKPKTEKNYQPRKDLYLNNVPLSTIPLDEINISPTPPPCSAKMSFNTSAEATANATVLKARDNVSLKAYECEGCELWHLTTG